MHLRKRFGVPMLIIRGDDDWLAPIGAVTLSWAKRVKNAILKVDPDTSLGLAATHKDQINAVLRACLNIRSD